MGWGLLGPACQLRCCSMQGAAPTKCACRALTACCPSELELTYTCPSAGGVSGRDSSAAPQVHRRSRWGGHHSKVSITCPASHDWRGRRAMACAGLLRPHRQCLISQATELLCTLGSPQTRRRASCGSAMRSCPGTRSRSAWARCGGCAVCGWPLVPALEVLRVGTTCVAASMCWAMLARQPTTVWNVPLAVL